MRLASSFALVLAAPCAAAQSFVDGIAQVPAGGPFNNSSSENVDWADVDLDGDFDVVMADGGDDGNDRNRLWINQGGAQGGTVGFFVDANVQLPGPQDTSRDVDFADLDGDGDPDLVVSNVSTQSNQSNRILINQGGLQAGTAGFFVDETSTRWVNLGVNDGVTTFSSIWPGMVLPTGGFVDWSGDAVLGDLDGDGDMDMVHSSYGKPVGGSFPGDIPTRLFLNDGLGFFEEFNPSGFQLTKAQIDDGDPAVWGSGVQQDGTLFTNGDASDVATSAIAIDLGDLDGDFDLDLLLGARQEQPRLFRSQLQAGVLQPFIDVTAEAFAQATVNGGNYEQELGDFDGDDDLDIYGINWAGLASTDALVENDGDLGFGAFINMPGSNADDEEADFFDFDADGDLDVYVANFSGADKLYENQGAPGYTYLNVGPAELPVFSVNKVAKGVDSVDVDLDGDLDVMLAHDNSTANVLLLNVTEAPDTHAPRVLVRQVGGALCGAEAVAVQARVFDNASWEWQRYNTTELEYAIDDGPLQTVPMRYSGGQLWYGEVPGGSLGTIAYRVRSTDRAGNAGLSTTLVYGAPMSVSYCTAGTSASGCQATLSSTGTPSATAGSGFVVHAATVEGAKNGLYYWSANGRLAKPWGNGTSWNCVQLPAFRSAPLASSGSAGACDGSVAYDLTARWQQKPAGNPGAGALAQIQLWYRDPQNTSNQTTSLSDGLEFSVCP